MRALTRRQRLAAIVLGVVALAFMTFDVSGRGLRTAHGGMQGALGSLYRGTDTVLGPVRRFVQGVPAAGTSHGRIQQLERDNAALRAQLAAAARDRARADRLAKLQLAADGGSYRIVPARVTGYGPGGGFEWTVTLDVGSRSGVAVDQTVTDGDGLVGRVLQVSASSSTVLLAADPGSSVGVRDERSGRLAVATGGGRHGYTLSALDPNSDLVVGDSLRTGPIGATSYVAGLAVGTVRAVHVSADGATTASVTPAVVPERLDLVGVILVGGRPAPRAALVPAR